jgi:hypothetical protein
MDYKKENKIIKYTRNIALLACLAYNINSCHKCGLSKEEGRFYYRYENVKRIENGVYDVECTKDIDTTLDHKLEKIYVNYKNTDTIHQTIKEYRESMENEPIKKNIDNKSDERRKIFLYWMMESIGLIVAADYVKKKYDLIEYYKNKI